MERCAEDGVVWLEFDLLADIPHLKHGVFLRHGGESQDPFHSLNVSYFVPDKKEHVDANIKKIQQILQIPKLVRARQLHDKHVAIVDELSPNEISHCDALITQVPNIGLMIRHADCQAAIFYDPKHRVIANAHAGWRGSVANIYGETIKTMREHFGTNPADLLVCISPSLGPDEAEFINFTHELPEEFWKFQPRPTFFDFWTISEAQLQDAGVLPHHIEISRLSTYSNPYDYFSYRRDKITGRHGTCVALTN